MLDKELVALAGDTEVQKGVEEGTLGKLLRLSREEESRKRVLYRRDRFNRALDRIYDVVIFPFNLVWNIILLPITILIDKVTDSIRGKENK